MLTDEILSRIIGASVAMYPTEIRDMLVRNGVYAPAPFYTINQLIDGVFIGLGKNPQFSAEYGSYIDQVITTLNIE